jgi:hypothetical protein
MLLQPPSSSTSKTLLLSQVDGMKVRSQNGLIHRGRHRFHPDIIRSDVRFPKDVAEFDQMFLSKKAAMFLRRRL